ncbi:NAD dependent epimerase/dehydratase [Paraphaeosphaeria minitans]|uniref:NAD dependent epimerase/dehydratase n=1 Tax=Paraphaeosphaeria minitans TaxID=565426 RepID=A0A9P6GQX9_9PLEO|nr:NAD dependent epimerase/dehydratase [Paraphaeosphaeria minitans]
MAHNVLLIGGHGKIAQLLTPLLLARSWNVTSMIRSADQTATIEKLGQGQPGKLSVLVSSVEDVQTESDAQKILDQVKPDWVVWSAGAGGRGGPSRTKAVDQDAAVAFTKASIHAPSIKKFLTVSYIASRRNRAPWWTDADWEAAQKVNNEILPHYYKAKVAADEVLTVLAKERFDAEAKKACPRMISAGGVIVGRIPSRGDTSRATVAETVVAVLETEGARGYIDVLDGDEDTGGAIKRLVKEGIDNVEGEDFENQEKRASQL